MIELSLRSADQGRFDVTLDERLIFSKKSERRFPNQGEILKLAEPELGPPINWR